MLGPTPQLLDQVVTHIKQIGQLDFRKQGDRHKGFFARRRAEFISSEPANFLMLSDPLLSTLKGRILLEFAQVEMLVAAKIAETLNDPVLRAPYLDLEDLAKVRSTTTNQEVVARTRVYRKQRGYRILAIGWRAAAIHPTVWDASADGTVALLNGPALLELIDRRLQILERLSYQVGNAEAMGGPWRFDFDGAIPWSDGFRHRMFEHPRVDAKHTPQIVAHVGASTIESENHILADPNDPKEWRWEPGRTQVRLNTGRIAIANTSASEVWEDQSSGLFVIFRKGVTNHGIAFMASDSIFVLVDVTNPSWRARSFLMGEDVLSALQLDALLFGRRQRGGIGPDRLFDQFIDTHPDGFLALGNPFWQFGPSRLMGPGTSSDVFFENTRIPEGDLQLGDQVFFANSFVFALIGEGEAEHALVMDLDSDPSGRATNRSSIRLQSAFSAEQSYGSFVSTSVAARFTTALGRIRTRITNTVQLNPSLVSADWNGLPQLLVRWEPYASFPSPGAWWIKIPLGFGPWATVQEAQADIFAAVGPDPNPGPGYHPPPDNQAVYFPIFQPAFKNSWNGYLAAAKSNPSLAAPRLRSFNIDGTMLPTLVVKGTVPPIPVLRPRVKL